ncbi:MAG: hypothetical protein HLUCCA08_15855 [Rhodobacteraceae bacterium HLUCCA08]|nr:MAG: hypothetical protein HLUCCA08_15855 [Rhodobacteraceae bacterium HLUCCA08]
METLIWIGAVLSALGLAGIVLSALRVGRARKANLSDEELKAAVQTAMPLNLGAFFVSMIGLGCVLVGVILG